MKAQLPRYQRLIPRPGQALAAAAPSVPAVGGIMPPQQGLPPQQPGMRHPLHGKKLNCRTKIIIKKEARRFDTFSLEPEVSN